MAFYMPGRRTVCISWLGIITDTLTLLSKSPLKALLRCWSAMATLCQLRAAGCYLQGFNFAVEGEVEPVCPLTTTVDAHSCRDAFLPYICLLFPCAKMRSFFSVDSRDPLCPRRRLPSSVYSYTRESWLYTDDDVLTFFAGVAVTVPALPPGASAAPLHKFIQMLIKVRNAACRSLPHPPTPPCVRAFLFLPLGS